VPHPDPKHEPERTEPSPHPQPYFLFVGRLEKMKGAQVLIEAFRNYSKADLLIVGDGANEAELKRQAQGLSQVHFLGRLPYSRLQGLFRHAQALLVPSIGYETLGIVILEAFVQGTPAIVNNLGALPDIVNQSGGGFVYHDQAGLIAAMENLRLDSSLRRQLGERGREAYFKYWTPEAHLPQYLGLIERIAAQKSPGRPISESLPLMTS
jgi:glycosyltransferase involved in cell wall biosynthesis